MPKVKLEEESTNPAKPSPSAPDTPATQHSKDVFENEFSHVSEPAQTETLTEKSTVEPTTTVKESVIKPTDTEYTKVETPKVTTSIPISTPPKETEIEFLKRLLKIQEEGGFGRHLDHIIVERIKSLY